MERPGLHILTPAERGLWPQDAQRVQAFAMDQTGTAAATAKLLQSCLTLCDPIDGSPPASTVLGILQARTLEWVAISFSNARKWNRSVLSDSSRPHGLQPTRLLRPWDFPGKSSGVGCHCLPRHYGIVLTQRQIYRSMEQNRKPRNKPTHLPSIYLWQRKEEYNGEKTVSLTSCGGKKRTTMCKIWNHNFL